LILLDIDLSYNAQFMNNKHRKRLHLWIHLLYWRKNRKM